MAHCDNFFRSLVLRSTKISRVSKERVKSAKEGKKEKKTEREREIQRDPHCEVDTPLDSGTFGAFFQSTSVQTPNLMKEFDQLEPSFALP